MKNYLFYFTLFFSAPLVIVAQKPELPNDVFFKQKIKKANGKITLDGILDEEDWKLATVSTPFLQSIPYDTSAANAHTEVRLTFNDDFLYVSAKCFQKRNKYVVLSLKRDFGPGTTDIFGMLIDPFCDKQNGFSFAISPVGVQREGLISNGNNLSTDWDNKWYSKVKNDDDFWTVEMAIPFKTLRYRQTSGQNEWNINFLRFDQSQPQAERSSWAYLPRFVNGNNLAFSGKLIWEMPPPKSGANISVIPYALGSTSRDFEAKKDANTEGGIGFDAKVAVTSSLNLDLTVNPDFAQVEVDQQQTNLSRFELFFPERRQFFLENADIFSTFGFGSINPFFSRRIGLAKDAAGNLNKVPILAGVRLTGKLDKNWRLGVLDIQTGARKDLGLPATNFLATSVQRKVFSRSLLSFIFVNKQNFLTDSTGGNSGSFNSQNFNRVLGLDYNLASSDGKWQGKFFYHRAFTPTPKDEQFATAGYINFGSTNFNFSTGLEAVGKNYSADVGYVERTNFYRIEPSCNYVFYPKSALINSWSLGSDADIRFQKTTEKLTDYDFSPVVLTVNFQNNAKIRFLPVRWDYTFATDAFDPTFTGGKKLTKDTFFTYRSTRIGFQSDSRKPFSFNTNLRAGEYFNGKFVSLLSAFSYRIQPYGVISLQVDYTKISLPDGFNSPSILLIAPRFDLSFTKNVFFTTFIQYNNQVNNVNVNARFQWRFKPVSDLFLVYTDNYFATDDALRNFRTFDVKNRGIILKCTYWLNL